MLHKPIENILDKLIELSSKIEVQEKCIDDLSSSLRQWKRYAEDLHRWAHTKYESDMARAMSEPNKPGYYRANND